MKLMTIQNGMIIKDTEEITDGYHTFGELYKHRIHLFIALCKISQSASDCMDSPLFESAIRAKIHEDGLNVWEEWGMFLLLLKTPEGQISYHLPKRYWNECAFAETQEKATIKFDGHTSEDVLDRLLKI